MTYTTSGQDHLVLAILIVRTKSLLSTGMYFVQCINNLLIPIILLAFYNIFYYKRLNISLWNRTIEQLDVVISIAIDYDYD